MAIVSNNAPARPRSYLFIDGQSLWTTLNKVGTRYFEGQTLPIDWSAVRCLHAKAFYYDAIPVQQYQEGDGEYAARVAPKRAELAAIERCPGFHVRSGDAVHRKRRGNEQKMVDVQLAVDALLMASRGLFEEVTLITGDLDFKPLVSALVEMGVDVRLHYPAGETSEDLIAAADSAHPIDVTDCFQWLDRKFREDAALPTASFGFQDEFYDDMDAVVSWDDAGFGRCRVVYYEGKFKLVSKRSPVNPATHRLELAAEQPAMLRAYAKDRFGLDVPEW